MGTMKNDCDVLLTGVEDVVAGIGNCLESAFDSKKTKKNVVGSLFGLGKSLTKLAYNTTTCAVKNAPKAVVAVAAVKREVIMVIEEEINEYQKQKKEDALDEKIKQLQLKA
jgi:16S rRNA C1402 (ribose-2'-O) methylase RsmI